MSNAVKKWLLITLAALSFGVGAGDSRAAESPALTYQKDILPLLQKYCYSCHGNGRRKADLALDTFKNEADIVKQHEVWEKVAQNLTSNEMPPRGRTILKPTPAERDLLAKWVQGTLDQHYRGARPDPGRVTVRRLNRQEYNNTMRDLVGVDLHPADEFPEDDTGYGFDTIGDVLSISPLLMEKYITAAEKVLDKAIVLSVKGAKAAPLLESHKRIFFRSWTPTNKTEAAREIINAFAKRAFRRPTTVQETERYLRLVAMVEEQNEPFEKGIKLALQAILVSPHFLFRWELDGEPGNSNATRSLNEHELASRLSFFLWSSMPDDRLFDLAGKGQLRRNLESEVRRMLKDPKANAFVANFAGQWLQLRNLRTVAPDPTAFPLFTDKLREDMRRETELFFAHIMREDRSVLEFIKADYTFVNERLAKLYGFSGVKGEQFEKISLAGTPRGGLLTHASVLTLTSNPTRTSPVKRGKYVLENILGTPPPPPPPNVPELNEEKALTGNMRQQMEQHRANPTCASCHSRMDPIGFGFENFNGIGVWRDKDGGQPINAADELSGGQQFNGPSALTNLLLARKSDFAQCLSEKMLTYATGRGLEFYDKRTVDAIAQQLAKDNYRFSSLIVAVVKSLPFDMKRGDGKR